MIRPLLCAAAVALAVSSVSQVIAANPRYALTQLRAVSTASGMYASVNDINNAGLAVGTQTRLGTGSFPSIVLSATSGLSWAADASADPTLLAKPSNPVVGASAQHVNDAGQIAGVAYYSSGGRVVATLAASGSAVVFPSTDVGSVAGINASGHILATGVSGPVLLRNGTSTALNTAGSMNVDAVGITDAGTMIGQTRPGFSPSPRPLQLSTTAAPTPLTSVNAVALVTNNAGVVGGYVGDGGTSAEAAIISGGVITRLGIFPYSGSALGFNGSRVLGLNDRGDAVGVSGPSAGSAGEQKTFLYRDAQLVDLATLIEGGTLPTGFRPAGINDRGQIIGNVYVDHDNDAATARIGVAYRLDPIRVVGDANVDGVVDLADLTLLAASYDGTGRAFYENGDFNYDWRVDRADLELLAANYATPQTLAGDLASLGLPNVVPEPASLAALGATALLARRRRREPC